MGTPALPDSVPVLIISGDNRPLVVRHRMVLVAAGIACLPLNKGDFLLMHATSSPRLIMVEGTIGSGKTTTATRIHRWLGERHIAAEVFLEGNVHHPADYEHTAWLGMDDWVGLLARWPAFRLSLEAVSRAADRGYLVPYGVLEDSCTDPLPDALYAALAERSVYDGTPLDRHRRLVGDRWRAFAQSRQASPQVTILECCFLQNPLMKFVVQHHAAPSALVEHLSGIVEALRPLRPIVLYLAPPDIEGRIEQACRERSAQWRDGIVSYIVGQDYGRARGLHGWEGVLTFLRHRSELERDILTQLPIDTVTIADDVAPQRWERVESLLSASFPLA